MTAFFRRRPHLAWLIAFAALVAIVWLTATPFAWDNDEAAHYGTSRDIYEAGGLPGGDEFPEIILPGTPFEDAGLGKYHSLPPTYYAATALLFNLNPDAVGDYTPGLLAGRILSAVLYVLAVFLVYEFVRTLNGGRHLAAATTAAACALIPKMASIGGSFTADSFALAAVTFLALATVRAVQSRWTWRATFLVGLAAALVLMSRPSALPILFFPAIIFFFHLPSGLAGWLQRGILMAITTILPNSWWLVRNWRNLNGDLFGATTQVEYQYSLGLPYATDEVFLFKASETGHSSIPEMILRTDWLLRFNTRLWLSERYNDGSGLGMFLAAVFVALIVAALVIAIRGAGRSPGRALQPAQRFVPLALLVVFLIAAVMTANNNYVHGLYVIGRYAMPPAALLLAATVGMTSRLDSPLGRYAVPAVAIVMVAVHITFWTGFMLPDLLRQIGPA